MVLHEVAIDALSDDVVADGRCLVFRSPALQFGYEYELTWTRGSVMDKAQNGVEHPSPGVDRIFYTTLSNLPDVTPPRSLMWSHTRMPAGPVWLRASEGLLPRANGHGSTMERSGMGCSS